MTQTKDNIINRDELQETYIKELIDGMDHKDMYAFVYDTINDTLDKYTVDELIEEVNEYDPDLLITNDWWTIKNNNSKNGYNHVL